MTPVEWNAALAPEIGWQSAYATVERVTRSYLAATRPALVSTNALVGELYPEQLAIGAGIDARKRLFKALMALAERGLADCVTRGPARKIGKTGRMGRPFLWHEPKGQSVPLCPHCGKAI